MNKLLIAAPLIALTMGAAALAQMDHRMDMDGDRTVTKAEAQTHAEQMFAMMDANKDGKLDAADRAAHQAQMFDTIDTNHDGSISRDEFAAMHPGGEGEMGHGQMDHGPGGPGMDKGRMGQHNMMGRMAEADTNHDGAVDKAEFLAAHARMFDQADTNHDGKVTPDERRAAMGKMMGGKHGGGRRHHGQGDTPPPPPAN